MRLDYGYAEESRIGKPYDLKLLQRLWPLIRANRRLMAWSIGLVLLITLLDLAMPYVTKLAIDRYIVPRTQASAAEGGSGGPAAGRFLHVDLSDPAAAAVVKRYGHLAVVEDGSARIAYEDLSKMSPADIAVLRRSDMHGLALVTGLFVLLVLFDFALNFAQSLVMEYAGQRIMHDLRMRIFTHIQGLALEFFTRNPVGRLVTRATSDVQNMYELFTSFVSFMFKDLMLLIGIAVVMLLMNWRLALVTFVVLPAVAAASMGFSRRARDIFRILRVQVAEINTRFSETIGGMRVIQLFRQEAANYRRFAELNHENYLAGMRQIRVLAVFMPLIEVLAVVAVALIIWYGGGLVLARSLSLGALVAFIAYIRMFFRPIRDLAEKYTILQNAMASAERLFMIMDTATVLPQPPQTAGGGGSPLLEAFEELRFENVGFSYASGEPVLNNLSFAIRRGDTVAVVGLTGAGKTTLINLIPRLYDPTTGRITINGRDLRSLPSADFRDTMALVMQDPFLFSGTIRENIFQEPAEAGREREAEVIDAANLQGLIDKLPRGLDTELGESGGLISSGERQLISIARAFARNPQLILFDEATSYIDSKTEVWIHQALERLMRRRTALIVAHRLSTVRSADRIMVLNRGRIIETGSHAELMDRKGFYFRLHQLQPAFAPSSAE
jgi:ATP-binding cassette subfamily B protein